MNKHYIAGIVDSCSHISFRKDSRTKNSVFPVMYINSNSIEVINQIKKQFGGTIYKKKGSYTIFLSHRKVLDIINYCYEYLIAKKEIAEIIKQFYEIRFTRHYEAERKKELVKKFLELSNKNFKNSSGSSSIMNWLNS